jgi:starvation-inducible outer membrane lipoprotein
MQKAKRSAFQLLLVSILLTACTALPPAANQPGAVEQNQEVSNMDLPNLGPAPEISGEVWINSDQPLTLAGLRGKVVILDMWTFG